MDRKLLRGGLVPGAGAPTTQWPTLAGAMLSMTPTGQLRVSVWSRSGRVRPDGSQSIQSPLR
jgi:hypothetical protein